MAANAPNFIANGTVQPSRFVKLDTTAGKLFNVIQAAANTDNTIIGISQPGSYDPPGTTGAASDAARAGLPLEVYSVGDVCLLEIGAGGVTAGDYLTPDANGKGVTLTLTDGANVRCYGAKALETASAGDKARVLVILGFGSLT